MISSKLFGRLKNIQRESYSEFVTNELVQDGVVRNLEIMGEAVKSIPEEVKSKASSRMEKNSRNEGHTHTWIFWNRFRNCVGCS